MSLNRLEVQFLPEKLFVPVCGARALPVCTENLNPHVVVMKSAKYGVGFDASGPLNWARDRRIFIQ